MASLKSIFGQTIGSLVCTPGTVVAVDAVGSRFKQLVVKTDVAAGRYAPGDKVQILFENGDFRTYTPFAVDVAAGTVSFLVFVHGDAPGSAFGRSVVVGDAIQFFGPRGSLPLSSVVVPSVLFGDETGFAVARALFDHRKAQADARFVFEVDDVAESTAVLERLGIAGVSTLIEKQAGDAHLQGVVSAIGEATAARIVLTGRAQSLQLLKALLKTSSSSSLTQTTRAYWSVGKRGLD